MPTMVSINPFVGVPGDGDTYFDSNNPAGNGIEVSEPVRGGFGDSPLVIRRLL